MGICVPIQIKPAHGRPIKSTIGVVLNRLVVMALKIVSLYPDIANLVRDHGISVLSTEWPPC